MQTTKVNNTSYILPSGEQVLRHEGIVLAPIAEVWNMFTTTEGLRSFMASVVQVDFRVGGKWEASYKVDAKIDDSENIVNEILSYLPFEMLSIRIVSTPPGFPSSMVAKHIWTVMQFEAMSNEQTRVKISMLGWQAGPEWDEVYTLFDRGNAYTLSNLQKRFIDGPIVWE
jgi:uncharacterized protein YndB with AHSA1/START domain